jgi:DNA polymerase I-like protein with 3'-5' exonuclease and polymerase domains
MVYLNVLDFLAVTKHAYYAAKNDDTLYCAETEKHITKWETAANAFLSMYIEPLDNVRFTIAAMDQGVAYRKSLFPEYKAHRKDKKQSPIEKEQVALFQEWAKKFLAAIGITMIGVPGVEADDVIAWISQAKGVGCTIQTVDGDLVQLVTENCAVRLKDATYFHGDEYKGHPTNVISLQKSLVGDPSDGYKGIKGFGEKAFDALVEAVGYDGIAELERIAEARDLKSLQEAVDSWDGQCKPLNLILANFAEWTTMWRIAKLHPELCWKPRNNKLVKPVIYKRVPNADKVRRALAEVGANDFYSHLEKFIPDSFLLDAGNWDAAMDEVKQLILSGDLVSFDYETSDHKRIERFRQASTRGDEFVDTYNQTPAGLSLCFGEHNQTIVYIPTEHKDAENVSLDKVAELLSWIQEQGVQMVAHNFFFEGVVTRMHMGITLDNVWDTRIMQRYWDENSPAGLKEMSLSMLGYNQKTYEETLGGKSKMSELTVAEVFDYGADDAMVTAQLCDLLKVLLHLDNQWEFYEKWAVNPTQMYQEAFIAGATLNWSKQKELHAADKEAMELHTQELRKLLKANVVGEVTKGCETYIEAEKDYVMAKYKADDKASAKSMFHQWKKKIEATCAYTPYFEEEIMPTFAYTAKQLSAAAVAVGLPEVEKMTLSYLGDYFDALGVTSLNAAELTADQQEFVDAFMEAFAQRVDKLNKEETFLRRKAFDKLAEVCQRLADVKPRIVKIGDELNLGSAEQMRALLYCKLGMPVRLFGQLGKSRMDLGIRQAAPSSDEKAIETALANDVEKGSWQEQALKHLLKAKSANTRITLFHNKKPLWAHEDGKIRPYLTDSGTDTRRPTGSSPNILQMPSKGDGYVMRSQYVPPHPDWVCVAIDYSGQELRIMASEADETTMIEAYTPGKERDIHSTTAVGIIRRKWPDHPLTDFEEFERARKDETHEFHEFAVDIRGKAKGTNFLMSYLGTAPTLARNLIIPDAEAEDLLSSTFAYYSRVSAWQDEVSQFMLRNGFTQTAFGTKRHATDQLFSSSKGVVNRQLRQGVNATIQGTAAEMLKIVLCGLWEQTKKGGIRFQFFAGIYDEIVSWVHKDDVVNYWHFMKELMGSATPPGHKVRQVPELSVGTDWGRTKELGNRPNDEAILKVVESSVEELAGIWVNEVSISHKDLYPNLYSI